MLVRNYNDMIYKYYLSYRRGGCTVLEAGEVWIFSRAALLLEGLARILLPMGIMLYRAYRGV